VSASVRSALLLLAFIVLVTGCASEEVDWRYRTTSLDMRPPSGPDAIGTLTVAGRVDAAAFTNDALWALVAVPTRRDLPINRVVRIGLADNRFSDLFAVKGFSSGAIAAGHDAIWVAEGHGGDNVHRIDPASQRIVASVALPRNPVGLAVDESAVWVIAAAEALRPGGMLRSVSGLALFRIDPVSNAIVDTITIPGYTAPAPGLTTASIAAAAGSVWVATPTGDVVRVDPRANRIVATLTAPGENGGRRTNYWLAAPAGRLYLVRQVKERVDLPAPYEALQTTVWEIDHRTNRLASPSVQFDSQGVVLFLGDEGAWLGSTRLDAIERADPGTFRSVAAPLKIGYPVYALAAGHGTLWAFSGARITQGDNRNITWITRVRTGRGPRKAEGEGQ